MILYMEHMDDHLSYFPKVSMPVCATAVDSSGSRNGLVKLIGTGIKSVDVFLEISYIISYITYNIPTINPS